MKRIKFLILALALIIIAPVYLNAQEGQVKTNPLGLKLGMSLKEATQIIDDHGNKIIEKTTDSKKVRTLLVRGSLVDLPLENTDAKVSTSLEFFDRKLMSSALIFKSDDFDKHAVTEQDVSQFLKSLYGEPEDKEKMLGITSWIWYVPKVKIVYSANPDNRITKVQYIYEPVNQAKRNKEIQDLQEGPAGDPAKEMFLDGNYSSGGADGSYQQRY